MGFPEGVGKAEGTVRKGTGLGIVLREKERMCKKLKGIQVYEDRRLKLSLCSFGTTEEIGVKDEREGLLAWINTERKTVRFSGEKLTADQKKEILSFVKEHRNPETDRFYDLGFGSMGNGLVVWNRADYDEKAVDYRKVAHISENGREVTYYADLPKEVCAAVEDRAIQSRITYAKKLEAAEEMERMKGFGEKGAIEPLEGVPKEWTKDLFVRAVLAGQVYEGKQDYRISEDCRSDYGVHFGKGKDLDLTGVVQDLVERGKEGAFTFVPATEGQKGLLIYSGEDFQDTFSFDLDCDLREAESRRTVAMKALAFENEEKLKECMDVGHGTFLIDPMKVYEVAYLTENQNTGALERKEELVQGFRLVDPDDSGKICERYGMLLSMEEQVLEPERLYSVSSLFSPYEGEMSDERFLPLGNGEVVVSGKALQEFTEEKVCFPWISDRMFFGQELSFDKAVERLTAFRDSALAWGIDDGKVDYEKLLGRVFHERERVLGGESFLLKDLIAKAKQKMNAKEDGRFGERQNSALMGNKER